MHVGTIISTSLALGLQVGTAVPGSDSRAPGFYGKHFTDGAVSPRPAVFTEILGLKLSSVSTCDITAPNSSDGARPTVAR